jgi:hypothetical protein
MYLVNTRTDICFAVNTLSQYMVEPGHVHLVETKYVLRYLHGMVGYGLRYVLDGEVKLQGYANFDWARSAVETKSTLGYCFSLGSGMISWLSIKQSSVAVNTTETEYIAANIASHEVVWLQKLLAGLFDLELKPTSIYYDN